MCVCVYVQRERIKFCALQEVRQYKKKGVAARFQLYNTDEVGDLKRKILIV